MQTRFLILLSLIAAAISPWVLADDDHNGIRLFKTPLSLENFTLVDVDHRPFTLDQLKHKWSLVYFGYLSCSDACPSTLSALRGAYKQLDARRSAGNVQVIFVSVDPHRDTLDRIKEHLRFFHPVFKGVTGDRAELSKLLANFGARFEYIDRQTREKIVDIENRSVDDDYIVGHWVDLLLFNPQGELAGVITPPHDPRVILTALQRLDAAK